MLETLRFCKHLRLTLVAPTSMKVEHDSCQNVIPICKSTLGPQDCGFVDGVHIQWVAEVWTPSSACPVPSILLLSFMALRVQGVQTQVTSPKRLRN